MGALSPMIMSPLSALSRWIGWNRGENRGGRPNGAPPALAVAAAKAAPPGLGPGAGPWAVEPASLHGLDDSALEAAANEARLRAPERYCMLVVKDGVIVHESTFANTTDTVYETDSLAKTATALVIGAAVQAGHVDLDIPIAKYGVKPHCPSGPPDCWRALNCPHPPPPPGSTPLTNHTHPSCPTGPLGYFPQVTARHLLAQSSGCVDGEGCRSPPGTAFSYDSGQYIQHLSQLIEAVSLEAPRTWATRTLMAKLGLPHWFDNDGNPTTQFSAGGGQLASCRDVARLGQLILNKGLWPTVGKPEEDAKADRSRGSEHAASTTNAGKQAREGQGHERAAPYGGLQLVNASYIAEMLTPQFATRGFSYGLLTWLNTKHEQYPDSRTCCAPRWGPPKTCVGDILTGSLLGDDVVDLPPHDLGMAMGWLGQYMYIVPSHDVVVVSMGASWGSALQCPLGHVRPSDPVYNDGYDDSFTASEVWRAMLPAVMPDAAKPDAPWVVTPGEAKPDAPRVVTQGEVKPTLSWPATRLGGPRPLFDEVRRHEPTPPPLPPPRRHLGRGGASAFHSRRREQALLATQDSGSSREGGSCSCMCPPGRGFGRCYAMELGVNHCSNVAAMAANDCPALGVTRQCHSPVLVSDTNCSAAGKSIRGDIGDPRVWGGSVNCELTFACGQPGGLARAAGPGGVFDVATCTCHPQDYGPFACTFSPHPCADNAYFPPGTQPE